MEIHDSVCISSGRLDRDTNLWCVDRGELVGDLAGALYDGVRYINVKKE